MDQSDNRPKLGERLDNLLSSPRNFGLCPIALLIVCIFVTVANFYSTDLRGTASIWCGVISAQTGHTNTRVAGLGNKSFTPSVNKTAAVDVDGINALRNYSARTYKLPEENTQEPTYSGPNYTTPKIE